jgi:hypothetical protein
VIDDEKLAASSVVANCSMNRDRGLTGRDGYSRVLGMDLLDLLVRGLPGPVRWLDLCCGRGNALLEAMSLLRARGLADRVRITGVDLITCVHGMHYVGDKLGVLAATASWLTADGELAANFDATGVRSAGGDPLGPRLTKALREAGFDYDGRTRRIRRHGHADVRLPFHYLGADDKAGPNYTGQPAVHSHYDPR